MCLRQAGKSSNPFTRGVIQCLSYRLAEFAEPAREPARSGEELEPA